MVWVTNLNLRYRVTASVGKHPLGLEPVMHIGFEILPEKRVSIITNTII